MVDFEENQKLVTYVLKQMNIPQTDPCFEDMVQEGSIGLYKACERYDPNSNCTFSTYAYWYIKGYIMKWYREYKNKPIKISRRVYDTAIHYRKSDSYEETAKALGVSVEYVIECVTAYDIVNNLDSLNRQVSIGDNSVELQEVYTDPQETDILDDYYCEEVLSKLTDKQRDIVRHKVKGYKQHEIAQLIGNSQSYVSREYSKALKILTEYYKDKNVFK